MTGVCHFLRQNQHNKQEQLHPNTSHENETNLEDTVSFITLDYICLHECPHGILQKLIAYVANPQHHKKMKYINYIKDCFLSYFLFVEIIASFFMINKMHFFRR